MRWRNVPCLILSKYNSQADASKENELFILKNPPIQNSHPFFAACPLPAFRSDGRALWKYPNAFRSAPKSSKHHLPCQNAAAGSAAVGQKEHTANHSLSGSVPPEPEFHRAVLPEYSPTASPKFRLPPLPVFPKSKPPGSAESAALPCRRIEQQQDREEFKSARKHIKGKEKL